MNDEAAVNNVLSNHEEKELMERLARLGVESLQTEVAVSGSSWPDSKRELYRKAFQIARSRERKAEPTDEEIIQSLLGSIPQCPRVRVALAAVPAETQEQWRANFISAFLDSQERSPHGDVAEHSKFAHHRANRVFRVERPETIEEARAIPEWKLLRRQEIEREELPEYAQAEVEPASRYLELFTIDGGRYFFPIPEAA